MGAKKMAAAALKGGGMQGGGPLFGAPDGLQILPGSGQYRARWVPRRLLCP